MKVPAEYDPIRPYEPEELPEVYDRLLQDPQFCQLLSYLYPKSSGEDIKKRLKGCRTNLDFQKVFCYPFVQNLIHTQTLGCCMDVTAVDIHKRYTFVSNHRDIVMDPGFLDKLLIDAGFTTTCEIAIGDNLLTVPWIRDLAKVNKAFTVERSLKASEMLRATKRMSDYMHFAIGEKKENVWIAQREGRAKDSNDLTQPAILKMMAMGGNGSMVERLRDLHIVPLAISYEYDPCDYLKAQEFQQKRDDPNWRKGPMDDVLSMKTGIQGYKGHVCYRCAPCMDEWLNTVDISQPRNKVFEDIALHIDREIHSHYRLYANNYIALDMLEGEDVYASYYTKAEKETFLRYIDGQLDKITLPNKDLNFLQERMLTMYANPARNFLAAQGKQTF